MDSVASMTLRERCNFPLLDCLHYRQAINAAVERVIDSGQTILSEGVRGFEEGFAAWLGGGLSAEHCLGVANGTDALELAMRCAGVEPGEGVIVPSFTAYATVAAILRVGAQPIFVDIEPGRPVLSLAEVERRVDVGPLIESWVGACSYNHSLLRLALEVPRYYPPVSFGELP